MFGMSIWEILMILAIALIVIGPKKLPELAKSLGRALGEFRRATSEIKSSFEFEEMKDVKKAYDTINKPLDTVIDIATSPPNETGAETAKPAETQTANVTTENATATAPAETETPAKTEEPVSSEPERTDP